MQEIKLTKGYVGLVDDEDYPLVSAFKWCAHPNGNNVYVSRRIPRKGGGQSTLKLHRFILGINDPSVQVDHINGDGLDNRRENLRPCTVAQNQQNRSAQRNNSSGTKGVYLRRDCRKWQAQIKAVGKNRYLGLFPTKEAAAEAYAEAAKFYFGEFANTGGRIPCRGQLESN
jgi:hypothetical protein